MEDDILTEILERQAALLLRPGQSRAEALALAAARLVAGVTDRWPPAWVLLLRAALARADAALRSSPAGALAPGKDG
jgi:hypothetical protein